MTGHRRVKPRAQAQIQSGQSSLSGVPNQEVGLSPLWSEDVLS